MTSAHVGDFVYRALLGHAEIYPFVVIEKVQLAMDEAEEPTLVASWRLEDMVGGGGFDPAFEGDHISHLRWDGDRLEFRFHGSRGQGRPKNLEGDLILRRVRYPGVQASRGLSAGSVVPPYRTTSSKAVRTAAVTRWYSAAKRAPGSVAVVAEAARELVQGRPRPRGRWSTA